jgi:hypothetical protein
MNTLRSFLLAIMAAPLCAFAAEPVPPPALPPGEKLYVIEREMPGVGKLTPAELKAAAQKSCAVLKELGPEIQWQYSFVTADKLYCVYAAPNEEIIREHAKKGGFPANSVKQAVTIISPKTAD